MKKLLLIFPLGLLLLSGCVKEEETGALEMTFKANYDGTPLVMLDEYAYDGGLMMTFQRFNFYIGNVALVDGSTKENLLDIEFVDFDNMASTEEATAGYSILVDEIPTGDYAKIQIGLGVPADLNATADSDYSGSHPLARASHYWPGWESFIFTMINAKVDSNGDGLYDDSSVLYHTGSDEAYRLVEYTFPIRIEKDKVSDLVFEVDLKALFQDGAGGYIDILANTNTHNIDDLSIANQVMDNFTQSLKIVN
ncbi:MAG: hypothetical protein KDC34_11345 [Saprospiraceae bacterium]|nr:hypothetical protein [Saprospiraceae bacterium]